MSEYKRPTVASLLSRRLRCWRTASQQLIDPATLADAKLESTLTTEIENNKNLHYHIADLNSRVKLAFPCELTRQNRHVHADLLRRRTTTRSPMVRLNSKLSKATLRVTHISNRKDQATEYQAEQLLLDLKKIGRTATTWSGKKVRRNKFEFKQRKSLAGDRRDADQSVGPSPKKCSVQKSRCHHR